MSDIILVIGEHRDGALKGISKEALTAARQFSGQMGGAEVVGVVLGNGVDSIAQDAAAWGATRVIQIEDAGLEKYTPEMFIAAIAQLISELQPRLVLMGNSYQAMDYYPRLAARLKAAFIPDVTAIGFEGDKPVFLRKVLNGKFDSKVHPLTDGPWLASLQQGAFPPEQAEGSAGAVEKRPVDLAAVKARKVVKVEVADLGEVDLSAADIIVSGGRGVGDKDKFQIVFDLAEALGGAVGASRPPCDAEIVGHERQVGSSGQVVAPKLYIAVGISGAIQHLVGMRGSQCIVGINKDSNAAIFQEAAYGIVGDLHEILPELIEAVKEAKEA